MGEDIEMKTAFKRNGVYILAWLLIALVAFAFCLRKQGMFLDEIYTYGLSNSQRAPWLSDVNGWEGQSVVFTQDELLDYLTVTETDGFDYASVYYNQTQDVHPPMYYFLLHTASSLAPGIFSKWVGLSVNLVLFAVTLVLYERLARTLFQSRAVSWLSMVLYGIGGVGLSTMLMIRMYILLTLLTILLAYLVAKHQKTGNKWLYPAIFLTIFSGMLTQYYYVFYAFLVCAFYDLYLLFHKKFAQFFAFSCSALAGVLCMFGAFPCWYAQLFSQEEVSAQTTVDNLLNVSQYVHRIVHFTKMCVDRSYAQGLLCAVLLVVLVVNFRQIKRICQQNRDLLESLLVIVPSLLAFAAAAILSPYQDIRYIYNVYPIMALAMGFLAAFCLKLEGVSPPKAAEWGGVLVLVVVALLNLVKISPSYLYTQNKSYDEQLGLYADAPCVYVSVEYTPSITSDLPELLLFDDVLVTDSNSTEGVERYVAQETNQENLVLFVATYPEPYGEDVPQQLAEALAFAHYELLRVGEYSETYLLSK